MLVGRVHGTLRALRIDWSGRALKTDYATLSVPADSAAIGRARSFTASFLQDHGLASLIDTVVLLVSELVTNAVLHSGSAAELRLQIGDRGLRVEVRDKSSTTPFVKHYSEMATTGRGMLIVDSLAKSWGSEADASGKVVWFTLDALDESAQPFGAGAQARPARNGGSATSPKASYHALQHAVGALVGFLGRRPGVAYR